jgi:hypothetical protein|tara:strand:+ start:14 stop:1978 length:1965 start_codon:yes stop_codon:yes gene_type:complete
MPLQAVNIQPGINRSGTATSTEGYWYDGDKIRFRFGNPEKIGGWVKDTGTSATGPYPPAGSFWGVCRSLWNWVSLKGRNYLALGTHLKLYVQDSADGSFYDINPLRATTTGAATFAATNGSSIVVVTDPGHGSQGNDFVVFGATASLGGVITDTVLNNEFVITLIDASTYSIDVGIAANASDTGNGGGSTTAGYEITIGNEYYATAAGWGAGGWGGATTGFASTGWGESAASGVAVDLRLWSMINYGEFLLANPRGGPIYLWAPSANPNEFGRAQVLASTNSNTQDGIAYWTTDTSCPTLCNIVHVSDSSRFVLAFGCNDYGSSILTPLLVRWSDQEDYSTWAPAVTNQAGSFSLSSGSQIIAVRPQRQEILVFTDAALYSMQYLGPPFVWGFQQMGTNISIISPNAVVTAANVTFWMGVDKFYMYDGRVQTLPCTVWQYVFNNINPDQAYQIHAASNEGFNEIWWWYCSAGSVEINRYVIFNYVDNVWYYGNLSRTAWIDSPLRLYPMATGYDGQLFYHENGVDDGSTNPPSAIPSFLQSANFDIGDGHQFGFVWRMLPDVKFDGSFATAPSVTFDLLPAANPGAGYGTAEGGDVISANDYRLTRQYLVQRYTQQVNVRLRGRQMTLRISSDTVGTQWQLGSPRIDIRPDGRR